MTLPASLAGIMPVAVSWWALSGPQIMLEQAESAWRYDPSKASGDRDTQPRPRGKAVDHVQLSPKHSLQQQQIPVHIRYCFSSEDFIIPPYRICFVALFQFCTATTRDSGTHGVKQKILRNSQRLTNRDAGHKMKSLLQSHLRIYS